MDLRRSRGDPDRIVYDSTQTILIGVSTDFTAKKGSSPGGRSSPGESQIFEHSQL